MGDLITASVLIERESPLADLELNDHTAFVLVEWPEILPGQWKRTTVEGDYQDGRVLVHATRTVASISAVVRVMGETWSAQQTNLAALIAALDQFSFTLTQAIEGVERTFLCECGDIENAEGTLNAFGVARGRQEYILSIPCQEVTA